MVEQTDEAYRARTHLQPIAAPSILGLYGFAGATLILASHVAGWWGDDQSTSYIWPFAAAFGGVALTAVLGTLALGAAFAAVAELCWQRDRFRMGSARRLDVRHLGGVRLVHGQCVNVRGGVGQADLAGGYDPPRQRGPRGRRGCRRARC